MSTMTSKITSLTVVYLTVYISADQRKHQSSASLAFVWGIPRGPVNSPHKGPVTRKMVPFDDVIMSRDIAHSITMTNTGYILDYEVTKHIPHLVLTGEPYGPFY